MRSRLARADPPSVVVNARPASDPEREASEDAPKAPVGNPVRSAKVSTGQMSLEGPN